MLEITELCDSLAVADLGDEAANNAVERFAEANFSRIINKSGFLMVRQSSSPHQQMLSNSHATINLTHYA